MRISLALIGFTGTGLIGTGVDAIVADKVVTHVAQHAIVKQAAQQGVMNGVIPGVITHQHGEESTIKAPIDHLIKTPEEVEKSKKEGRNCIGGSCAPEDKKPIIKLDEHAAHHHHHHHHHKVETGRAKEFLGDEKPELPMATEETNVNAREANVVKDFTEPNVVKESEDSATTAKTPEEKAKEDEARDEEAKEKEEENDTWWWLDDGKSKEEDSKNEEHPDPTKITEAEENDLERTEEGLLEGVSRYIKKEYPGIYNASIGPVMNSASTIKQITNDKLGNIGAGLIAAAPQVVKPFYKAQVRPFMKGMHKYVLPIVVPYVAIAMGALNGFRWVSSEKVSTWVKSNFPFSSRLGEFSQHQALNLPVLMAVRGWFGVETQKFMKRGYGFFKWFYDKVGYFSGVTTGVLTRVFRGLPSFFRKETTQDLTQSLPLAAGLENLQLPARGIKDPVTGELLPIDQQALKNLRASYKSPEQIAAQENGDPVLHIRNVISDGVFGFAGKVLSPIDKLLNLVFGWALTPLDYIFANPYVAKFLDHGRPSRFVGHLFRFVDDWFQGKPMENIQAVQIELLADFLESEKDMENNQPALGQESNLTIEEEANALGIPDAVNQLGIPKTPTQQEIQTQLVLQEKIKNGVQLTDREINLYKQGVEQMKLINTNMPTTQPLMIPHHSSITTGAAVSQFPRALTAEEFAKLQTEMEEAKKLEMLKPVAEDPAEVEMREKIMSSPHTPMELLNHTGDAKKIFGDMKSFATNPSKDNLQRTLRDTLAVVKQDPAVVAEIQQAVDNVKDGTVKRTMSNLIHGNPSQDDMKMMMSAVMPLMMGKKVGEDDGMGSMLSALMGSKMGIPSDNGNSSSGMMNPAMMKLAVDMVGGEQSQMGQMLRSMGPMMPTVMNMMKSQGGGGGITDVIESIVTGKRVSHDANTANQVMNEARSAPLGQNPTLQEKQINDAVAGMDQIMKAVTGG